MSRPNPPPARPIPKPLAAYRLGLLSNTLWLWHKVFWDMPENVQTWDGVPYAVDLLREARRVLSCEIHPNVFAELDRVLKELDHMARTLVEAWQGKRTIRGMEFGSGLVPGVAHWEELRLLADRALAGDPQLRPWFDYGAAAGAYQLELRDYQPDPDDLEPLPDIGPLVQKARMLPEALLQKIPLLRSLVEMAPILESDGQGTFLEGFLGRNRERWDYFCDRADHHTVNAMGFTLDACVQAGLMGLDPEPATNDETREAPGRFTHGPETAQGPPPQDLPEWDKENLLLRWKGEIVRKVKFDAEDVILIFDSCHELEWRTRIPNPLPGPPENRVQKLDSAIKTLNSTLKMLRFHTARGCTELWWEPIQPD